MKSKRIGVLTYTNTTNYGAILQSIALKRVIEGFNYECDIINYSCEAVKKRERLLNNEQLISAKTVAKNLTLLPINIIKKIKISSFIKGNNIQTEKQYNRETIKATTEQYDTYIVGSDQVWNPKLNGNDLTYMLNFVDKCKKISYAASIGNCDLIEQHMDYYDNYIKKFDHIGIREKKSCEVINDTFDVKASFTLDPTMLIEKKEWLKISNYNSNRRKTKRNYLLLYFIHNGEKTFSKARYIAHELGYDIIYLNNYGRPVRGMKNIYSVTPYDFINYINDAKLIITGSFHGIAFSINQNKQFLVELANNKNNVNERIQNLIDIFSLNNAINDLDEKKFSHNPKAYNIDYRNINKNLNKCRKQSLKLLEEWLEK